MAPFRAGPFASALALLALSAPQHADARPLATSSSRGVPFRGVGRSLTQFILPDPREVPDASQLPWQTNSSVASESTHREEHSHARKHARRDERRADGAARDADDADAMQRQLESWYATTDEHNRPTVDPERAAWYAAHENDDYMPPEPPAVEPPASPPLPLFLDRPGPDANPPADDVGVKGGWWMKDPSETAKAVDAANDRPRSSLVRDGRPIGEVRWETREDREARLAIEAKARAESEAAARERRNRARREAEKEGSARSEADRLRALAEAAMTPEERTRAAAQARAEETAVEDREYREWVAKAKAKVETEEAAAGAAEARANAKRRARAAEAEAEAAERAKAKAEMEKAVKKAAEARAIVKRRVRAAEAEAEAAERAKAEKEKAEAKAKAKAVRAELEAPYRKWWSTLRKERNEKVGTPKTRGDVLAEIEAEESRFQSWMAVQMKSEAAKAQAAKMSAAAKPEASAESTDEASSAAKQTSPAALGRFYENAVTMLSLDPGKLLSSSSPSFSSGVHDVKSSEASLGRVNPPGTKGTSEKTSRSEEAADFLEEASRRASDMLHEEMGASETKGGYAAALEEQTKDAKRSTSQSSRSKSSSAESTSTASLAGHRHPSKGEGSASKSKRGSKASGKHGSKAHAKTASEEIQLSIQDLLHDNEPDVASAGAVRPEGVVPENWAEDEIIVDQRVSRGAHFAAGAVVVGVLCVYARARLLREREEALAAAAGADEKAALSPE